MRTRTTSSLNMFLQEDVGLSILVNVLSHKIGDQKTVTLMIGDMFGTTTTIFCSPEQIVEIAKRISEAVSTNIVEILGA